MVAGGLVIAPQKLRKKSAASDLLSPSLSTKYRKVARGLDKDLEKAGYTLEDVAKRVA
jgi:hypothetical protein